MFNKFLLSYLSITQNVKCQHCINQGSAVVFNNIYLAKKAKFFLAVAGFVLLW